jgi:hypothetical protein
LGRIDYYATLAKHLEPTAFAKAAARRAYRSARQVLYRTRSGVTEKRLLESLGVARREDLVRKVLDQRMGQVWCEVLQRASVLAAVEAVPGARERALARAEAAVIRSFDVFGTRICFGESGHTDWSLDVVSGFRYPNVPVDELPLRKEGSDPKFPWVLGRLDHLIALGQGYWIASDRLEQARYARAFVDETADFIRSNPVGIGIHWTCPMEVALRAANLAQALAMFADAPRVRDPDFLYVVLASLAEHADFVEANLEDHGAVPNNHLVANHVGLLVVGLLFPDLPGSSRQVALAANGLRAEMAAQVHPDGGSFEGSIPYHRLSVELFTLAHVVAARSGVNLGDAFTTRLERMFAFTAAYCSEEGRAPQLGDNDSGRVFPFADRESLDHGYLPALGAALFGQASLKRQGDGFPDEAAWLLGKPGLSQFQGLVEHGEPGSWLYKDSGWAVLRGGGAVLTASVGRNGQRGIGGHSHNDKLSFELHVHGEPVIVDPGSPTYTRDPAKRNAYRGTSSHNTLELDTTEQAPLDPARLFALPDAAGCEVEVFQPGNALDRLSARHHGYEALAEPVEVSRTFVLDKERRALGITDTLRGEGWHQVTSRLHLPDGEARLRPLTQAERARAAALPGAPRQFEPAALELGPMGAARAVVLVEAGLKVELQPYGYSPGYGQTRPALALVVRRSVQVPARMGWVVLWS